MSYPIVPVSNRVGQEAEGGGGVIQGRDVAMLDYIDHGRLTIPGWFAKIDALLFVAIHESQAGAGRIGDLMEIGTYMGRSAILLGYFQQPGERLIVCDIFEDYSRVSEDNTVEHRLYYSDLTQQAFERNFRRFHGRLPDVVVAGPSRTVPDAVDDYKERFRLIHVDGAHDYAEVQADIQLSRELLADGGVVIFDDITSPHTPGVAAAVWSAVINDGLIPHVVTKKLYASWSPIPSLDLSVLGSHWRLDQHDVADHRIIHPTEVGAGGLRSWIPPALLPMAHSLKGRLRFRGRRGHH